MKAVREALAALREAHDRYDMALDSLVEAKAAANELRTDQGRVRRDCGRAIDAEHRALFDASEEGRAGKAYKPLARDTVDKQAGDHIDYVTHTNQLRNADDTLARAQSRADSAKEHVRTAREVYAGEIVLLSVSTTAQIGT